MRIGTRLVASVLLIGMALSPLKAAGSQVERAALRGATKSATKALQKAPVYRRPWGPRHHFRKETRIERYTNRPLTDKHRGLPRHSFWKSPEPGRKGSATHLRQKLNIPHPVKRREEIIVKHGSAYHERPIKGGRGHAREVILEKRVPGKELKLRESLSR